MSYEAALERVKKLSDSPGTQVTKVTKPPYGTFGTPPSKESQKKQARTFRRMRDAIDSPGTWRVVTVQDGRLKVVRQEDPRDPGDVAAVWDFRRITITGGSEWMIGRRDEGAEIAWCVRRSSP